MYSLWQDLSHDTIIFDLVTLTLKFDLLLKNFNLGHNFRTRSDRAFILHVYSLWQDLSQCSIIFDLVTLTLKFDLFLENLNLGYYFQTRRDRAFILQIFLQDLSYGTIIFNLLTLKFDLLVKNFNFGCYLMMVAARRPWLSSDNSYNFFWLRVFLAVRRILRRSEN